MRPFQLLSAIAIFLSLETVEAAAYWNCNGTPIPDERARSAARLAFSFVPNTVHGYPSVYRVEYPGVEFGTLRTFPIKNSDESWQGGNVDYYVLANIGLSVMEVFVVEANNKRCTKVAG
ncbi:BgtE-5843 [Blumeria graminis f. sp. tritici]|uniref:BgtE-5843 n=2 Tax=Blumeria graminis f. sp. tritici TaxID=62690 RepID=A0A1L5JEG2_BLUGR|nr:BgtE-5843_p [Blumeria graminis f. sp. tritici]VDB88745.1 BgtE-5843 [Blumeria graminis f. sp. tritici]